MHLSISSAMRGGKPRNGCKQHEGRTLCVRRKCGDTTVISAARLVGILTTCRSMNRAAP